MEDEIINIAIENLREQANIKAKWVEHNVLDGVLKIPINNTEYEFHVEVKKELRQHQLAQILKLREDHQNLIIIAAHIYPKIKEQLRANTIPYLEANGNFYLQTKNCFCFIDTNTKIPLKKEKANRAFTKTGLKILFHLLNDPELVNKNQREIAETAGVALGNIPQVLNGLRAMGYLLPLKKGRFVWEEKEELINRWINGYETVLRPHLKKGTYAIIEDWRTIKLDKNKTLWGGEPAADLLTNHLRPEKFVVYTLEQNIDLIKNYKLIPKDNGELDVLKKFWQTDTDEMTAPPLLIYAELMITGGKRNVETAQLIYDEYIKPKL